MSRKQIITLVIFVVAIAVPIYAQQLTPIDPEQAKKVADLLLAAANKIEGKQVKFEAVTEKAVGLRGERVGMIVIPSSDVKDDNAAGEETAKSDPGLGVGYLFFSKQFSPVVDGKRVDAKKLRTVKWTTPEGEEREVVCLILAARQLGEDDWHLYVYGSEAKPLVQPSIMEATSEKPSPIAIDVTNIEGTQSDLVVTLLGKYSAKIRLDYQKE